MVGSVAYRASWAKGVPVLRTPVQSTVLASVGYCEAHAVLEIQFNSGRVHRYYTVPKQVHEHLMAAPSKGAFFNRFIRGVYPSAAT